MSIDIKSVRPWQGQAQRYWAARDAMEKYTRQGYVFELNAAGDGFEILSYALDEQGEYIPVPPAILEGVAEQRELILRGLLDRRESLKRITAIWMEHDPEYRAMYGPKPVESPANE